MCRAESGGLAQLPDPGGIGDQSAWLLDAFNACGAAEAEISRQEQAEHADRR